MFDVLTYEKGASVLRMLEQHIGPTVFRDGVRDYLRAHAYGNADTNDLWVSLGKIAKQPVPELMNGWIFQPGYPARDRHCQSVIRAHDHATTVQLPERRAVRPITRPAMADPTPDANHRRRQDQHLAHVADGEGHDSPAPPRLGVSTDQRGRPWLLSGALCTRPARSAPERRHRSTRRHRAVQPHQRRLGHHRRRPHAPHGLS